MSLVYQRLLDKWLGCAKGGVTLKTDLYDEAISTYNLIPLLYHRCARVVGTDVSFEVVIAAKRRLIGELNGWRKAQVSDIRNLSFKSDTFDQIISNSTLDHFNNKKDIIVSLKELRRVLKPGGVLIITLDNPSNPVVFIRNLLSYRLLKFFGIIQFYMGVTVSHHELIDMLKSIGFSIHDCTAIDHPPRFIVVWIGYVLEKIGARRVRLWFLRLIGVLEHLGRFATRYLTGYSVAVKAVKK